MDEKAKIVYKSEPIEVDFDDKTKIKVSDGSLGPKREDRKVVINKEGKDNFNTSSIMMGYNKEGIKLLNGEYVSVYELEEALKNAVERDGENYQIVYKKENSRISYDSFIKSVREILKEKSQLIVGEPSPKVANQDTARIKIKGEEDRDEKNKGILMLGNHEIELSKGVYVTINDIQKALEDYMLEKPEITYEKVDKSNKKEEPENRKIPRIISIIKDKLSDVKIGPLIGAAMVTATMFLSITKQGITKADTFDATLTPTTPAEEPEKPEVEKPDYVTGNSINMPKDITYHHESDWQSNIDTANAQFGNEVRPEGTYKLEYFSIIKDGQIIDVEYEEGVKLEDVINRACEKNGINKEAIDDIEFHIGGPVSGWVSMKDIEKLEQTTPENLATVITPANRIHVHQEDYNGVVLFQTPNGPDKINVNNSLDLLKNGDLVTSENGNQYIVSDVKLKTDYKYGDEKVSQSLSFGIDNITTSKALAVAAIDTGLVAYALAGKKKKEEEAIEIEQQLKEKKESLPSKFKKLMKNFFNKDDQINSSKRGMA